MKNGSSTKAKAARKAVHIFLAVALSIGLTLTVGLWLVGKLLASNHCADSRAFWGLVYATVFLLVIAFLIGWLPGLSYRTGRIAALFALLSALVVWVPMCVHWPPLNRGFQKRAMADIRAMAEAIEQIRLDRGRYPTISSVAELNRLQSSAFPEVDPWGTSYSLSATPDQFRIISYGDCGEPEPESSSVDSAEATYDPGDDIVCHNGVFLRYPE
jgi:hypothetical protein